MTDPDSLNQSINQSMRVGVNNAFRLLGWLLDWLIVVSIKSSSSTHILKSSGNPRSLRLFIMRKHEDRTSFDASPTNLRHSDKMYLRDPSRNCINSPTTSKQPATNTGLFSNSKSRMHLSTIAETWDVNARSSWWNTPAWRIMRRRMVRMVTECLSAKISSKNGLSGVRQSVPFGRAMRTPMVCSTMHRNSGSLNCT